MMCQGCCKKSRFLSLGLDNTCCLAATLTLRLAILLSPIIRARDLVSVDAVVNDVRLDVFFVPSKSRLDSVVGDVEIKFT